METTNIPETEYSYSPSALLNLFNNALNVNATKNMIQVTGIYQLGKGYNYNGYYYDTLKDEASDAYITLIVPGLIRNKISPNKTIIFWGYITKKVVNNGGRIDLQINLSELIEQTHNKYSEEELKALELQQHKAKLGYRDVESFIKNKIIQGEQLNIALVIGRNAIIDQDIKHQLEETINYYNITYHRVSFVSEPEITKTVENLNDESTDVIIIARGGGENIEIFNKPALVEKCVELTPYFITAIGHKDDVTLIQKIADKAFITPTALGQFLNDVYNDTIEELQDSKAKLVEDITKSLKANFEKQIQNLNEQLKASEVQKQQVINDLKALNEKEKTGLEKVTSEKINVLNQTIKSITDQQKAKEEMIANYKKQVDSLQAQLSRAPKSEFSWGVIIVGIIIGIIIGMALAG